MRKVFTSVLMIAVAAGAGFAARNTTSGNTIATRFEKIADRAKEKGKELFDREKRAKDAAKDLANEVAEKMIDRFVPGGDNEVAKAVADVMINHDPWWKAAPKVFFTPSETGESQFTQPQQQVANTPVVPANSSNDTAGTTTHIQSTPVVPAGPSNENASAPPARAPVAAHEGGGFTGSQHDQTSTVADNKTAASNGTPEHQNDAGANASTGKSKPVMLEPGKTSWVQANIETSFNPNRELANGNAGQNGSAITRSAPASTSTAPAAPSATPAPPSTTSSSGFGWFGGAAVNEAGRSSVGNSAFGAAKVLSGGVEVFGAHMGGSVGVTTVSPGHDPSGHSDHGRSDPPGHWAGPDHADHVARDTA